MRHAWLSKSQERPGEVKNVERPRSFARARARANAERRGGRRGWEVTCESRPSFSPRGVPNALAGVIKVSGCRRYNPTVRAPSRPPAGACRCDRCEKSVRSDRTDFRRDSEGSQLNDRAWNLSKTDIRRMFARARGETSLRLILISAVSRINTRIVRARFIIMNDK